LTRAGAIKGSFGERAGNGKKGQKIPRQGIRASVTLQVITQFRAMLIA
jgi:hypothetical protein